MMTKTCPCCATEKPSSAFGKDETRKDGLVVYCKDCCKSKRQKYAAKGAEYQAIHRRKHADKRTNYVKQWKQANKDRVFENVRSRKEQRRNACPVWADKEKIRVYYKIAAALNAAGMNVHVDHIVPIRGKNVCGLHVAHNLQVIPASENLSKSNRMEY